jgi:drug/metabolite transporter (DMT)-like permease
VDTRTAYLWGVTAGLAGALLHAGANILDSYLSNRPSQRLSELVAVSTATNLLFLPLAAAIDPPRWIGGRTLVVIALISCINVLYHFPYYRALQDCDTSIVSSLFSLGKLFTPLLAFLLLKESLAPVQYVGFFFVVTASAALTFDRATFRFQKALLYMLGVSLSLVFQAVLFKKLYEEGVSWGTSVVWSGAMDFVVALSIVALQRNARELWRWRRQSGLLVLNQLLAWTGEVLGLYALTRIPVSVFEGVDAGQPMFVLLLSMAFARRFPDLLKEDLAPRHLGGKAVLFVVMLVGTLMIARPR